MTDAVCGQTLNIKTVADYVIKPRVYLPSLRVSLVEYVEHSKDKMWVILPMFLAVHLLYLNLFIKL